MGKQGWPVRAGLALVVIAALSGCGERAIEPPSGPRASPSPDGATAVLRRACAAAPRSDTRARDLTFMQSAVLRQEAQLQRVADDLTGAVPGGQIPTDVQLPQGNARDIVALVDQSALCSPLKEKVLAAAKDLASADESLARSGGGGVAAALQTAQSMLRALRATTENPPAS